MVQDTVLPSQAKTQAYLSPPAEASLDVGGGGDAGPTEAAEPADDGAGLPHAVRLKSAIAVRPATRTTRMGLSFSQSAAGGTEAADDHRTSAVRTPTAALADQLKLWSRSAANSQAKMHSTTTLPPFARSVSRSDRA